jgi:hypothetical protein
MVSCTSRRSGRHHRKFLRSLCDRYVPLAFKCIPFVGNRILYLAQLALRRDCVLQIVQCQSTIHVPIVIFPCNAEPDTPEPLPLCTKLGPIHLEIFQSMARVQSWKRDDAHDGTAVWLPSPDTDRALRLRDSSDACVGECVEIEGLLWRAIMRQRHE